MPRKINFEFLRNILPEDTFNILNAPTKDELTLAGQRELPFPGGETDFLPREVVEEDLFDKYLGADTNPNFRSGPAQVNAGPTQGTFLNDLESSLPPARFTPQSAPRPGEPPSFEETTPTWNAPEGKDMGGRLYAPPKDYSVIDTDPDVLPPGMRAMNRPIPYTPMSPENVDLTTPTEWDALYGTGTPLTPEMPPGTPEMSKWALRDSLERQGLERKNWTPKPRKRPIAQPGLEQAVQYGQDVENLPAGRYEEYSLPEGRGARFVPQDPTNMERFALPEPGIEVPSLTSLLRQTEDLTGEGVAQPLMPTRVPRTPNVEDSISELERLGIASREQLETVWDRVSGQEGEAAEAKFLDVVNGIMDHYNGFRAVDQRADGSYEIEPFAEGQDIPQAQRIRNAQQYFNSARKFIPGIDGEGFGERVLEEDTGFNRAQIGEGGYSPLAQGFRGNDAEADARQDFAPTKKTLNKKEKFLVAQEPLRAIDKRPGLTTDQVQNFLTGSADIGVVPRGSLQPGKQRVQGSGKPSEVEVLKVVPLQGKPGYLAALSKRSGIPLRTLQTMVDGGMELDVVQVRRPSGKEGAGLPPEGRWRSPEDIAFWKGDEGDAQREKFNSDPEFLEKFLSNPGARATRADKGIGRKALGIVRRNGRKMAIVDQGGKKVLRPLEEVTGGKQPPANYLEKDPTRGVRPFPASGGKQESLRSSEGTPVSKEYAKSQAFTGEKPPIAVKGLQLAPKPIRSPEEVAKVNFLLAYPPKDAKGGSVSLPPTAQDASRAELTLVFNPRKPSDRNPEGLPRRKPEDFKPRELYNPSPEEIVEVLSRSKITKVAIKVAEGANRGPNEAVWDRVRAILKQVKGGKALALAGAGAVAWAASEEEAEAAPKSLGESFGISKALRESAPPPARPGRNPENGPSLAESLRTTQLDMFDPIYRAIREHLGLDETPVREVIQTAHGGGGGEAEIDYEPIRLHQERFASEGLGDDFNALLTKKQGLRQWDVVARKRDQLIAESRAADVNGDARLAKKKMELAKAIDDRMARKEVWEQQEGKEDLTRHIEELAARVGPEKFSEMEAASQDVYRQIQLKLDELYAAGLVPEKSYQEYKDRGLDHIPAWKTPYVVGEDGKVTYTGGKPFETHTTSIEGTTEQLLEEVMGSPGVAKSPFDNAAKFITEATAEIARTKIAKAVLDAFGPSGMAKKVYPKPGDKASVGNSFYTIMEGGRPQTYELPTYLVETLLMTDKEFTRKFLSNMTGIKGMHWARAIPEAAMTTVNLGFGATQAMVIDPITALVQTEWGNNSILKNIIPFYTKWAKHLMEGFSREWIGGESSELRKRAGKAGALYSGASSLVADPRDVQGNKGFSAAKESWAAGKKGQAINEGVNALLAKPARKVMQPFEEATKLATFDLLTSQGVDDTKAAYQTRKYGGSPDWAQTGSKDVLLRTAVVFGRPALLGIEAGLMSAKRNPKKLAAVMAGSLAFEAGRQAFNQLTASELGVSQEDLDNRFSEYDKDNTVMFFIPPSIAKKVFGAEQEILSNGIERPFAVKHTIPPVLRLWLSPFKGLAKALKEGNALEAPLAIADEMLPGTVPLKADDLTSTLLRRGAASLPAPIRWAGEQATDTQAFTGAPIVGSRLEGLPAEEQFSDSTQPFYKEAGKALGLSPKRLEHTGKTFLPGVLETPIQLLNALTPKEEGVSPVEKSPLEELGDIPFVGPVFARRFTPQRYEEELGDLQDDFYGLSERTKAAAGAVNKFNQGIGSDPSALTEALGGWNPEVAAMVRSLSEISTAQKQIVHAKEMSGREKRDAIKQLVDQKRELLRNFLSNPSIKSLLSNEVTR